MSLVGIWENGSSGNFWNNGVKKFFIICTKNIKFLNDHWGAPYVQQGQHREVRLVSRGGAATT